MRLIWSDWHDAKASSSAKATKARDRFLMLGQIYKSPQNIDAALRIEHPPEEIPHTKHSRKSRSGCGKASPVASHSAVANTPGWSIQDDTGSSPGRSITEGSSDIDAEQ